MLRMAGVAAILLLALSTADSEHQISTAPAPARKTVLAWIAGNSNESAEFVLRGSGRGAVNAVSVGGLFSSAANATNVWLTVNQPAIDAHAATWKSAEAHSLGIRTYPSMNLRWDVVSFRVLAQPHVQKPFIADLVAAIAAADVDGLNIDFEPPNPKKADGSL